MTSSPGSIIFYSGQRNTKFPTNERELRPYCNLALRTFDLVGAYNNKCMPDFGKSTANVFMHGIGNELKGICKTGKLSKRARELLKAAPCANSGLANWQKCNRQLIEKFTGIVNAPIKMRIPMGCWYVVPCSVICIVACSWFNLIVDKQDNFNICFTYNIAII